MSLIEIINGLGDSIIKLIDKKINTHIAKLHRARNIELTGAVIGTGNIDLSEDDPIFINTTKIYPAGRNKTIQLNGAITGLATMNTGNEDAVPISTSINVQSIMSTVLSQVYPVGAIYIGTTSTCPLATFFGTWRLISAGKTIQQATLSYPVKSYISAGLPNITGTFPTIEGANKCYNLNNFGDAIYLYRSNSSSNTDSTNGDADDTAAFDASRCSSIYGNSTTVQPPAYAVNIWERIA